MYLNISADSAPQFRWDSLTIHKDRSPHSLLYNNIVVSRFSLPRSAMASR
uniref:Uncharacterized protein n=1 Tax=Arundo donax TaxID=35708 RepID=A0A0A9EUI6_ARUDO